MLEEYLTRYKFSIITESSNIHPDLNRDKTTNYFVSYKPKSIVIYDTYNNPFFPYSDIVFDKATFDLPRYHDYLNKKIGLNLEFLPFHYYIEYITNDYYIINTRPLLMKPLIEQDKFKQYEESIHICILGDTNSDIYDKSLYKKLHSLLKHLFIIFKWGNLNKTKIKFLNIGKNFYENKIFVS